LAKKARGNKNRHEALGDRQQVEKRKRHKAIGGKTGGFGARTEY
jgi:hypothetical protein